jgi:phosphoglycerate dehydrogenase-like enzyme
VPGDTCKVLTTSTWLVKALQQRLPPHCEVLLAESRREADLLPLMGEADVLVGVRATRTLIAHAPRLRLIQAVGTGVDRIDVDAAAERGIIVCNAVGLNAVPVAEHALALLLALVKKVIRRDRAVRRGRWRTQGQSVLLHGKTVGIVGLGSIGIEVCKRVQAFGMRVIALKRSPSKALQRQLGIDFLGGPKDLPHILQESDVVVVSVVLTPATRRMIGAPELLMMRPTAYLVNVARGGVIDEAALVAALREGRIAGAGLDVFVDEPIRPDHPLLRLDNVVLTPHVAGGGGMDELKPERADLIAGNIVKVLRGDTPANIVNPEVRYVVKDYWTRVGSTRVS